MAVTMSCRAKHDCKIQWKTFCISQTFWVPISSSTEKGRKKWRSINPDSCCRDKFSSVDGNTWHTESVFTNIHSLLSLPEYSSWCFKQIRESWPTNSWTKIYSFCACGGLYSLNKYLWRTQQCARHCLGHLEYICFNFYLSGIWFTFTF